MTTLIAVYRDRHTADAAAARLREREGVSAAALRVAEPQDHRTSIEAEMDAEVAEGWASGIYGFMTMEMMRGAVLFGLLGGTIGALAGAPVGLLLYDDGATTLTRLMVGALIGALFGSVVGAMLGGGMAMKSPEERLAGERGVPLRVDDASREVAVELAAVMAQFDPIRIDEFEAGKRVATVATEGPSGVAETVGEFLANTADPRRR